MDASIYTRLDWMGFVQQNPITRRSQMIFTFSRRKCSVLFEALYAYVDVPPAWSFQRDSSSLWDLVRSK